MTDEQLYQQRQQTALNYPDTDLVRYERGDGKPFVAWKVIRCVSHNLGGYKVVEERYPYTRAQWDRHIEYELERDRLQRED